VIFVVLGGIGLPGGAVYINHNLLRSRGWETGVALAGPAMNVLLIVLIGIGFKSGLIPADPSKLATISLAFLFQLQVSALLLNLIPVPPLDGFQAIAPWLPPELRGRLYGMANIGMFVLFIALWFIPPFRDAFWDTVYGVCDLMGVNPYWGRIGYRAFRFWEQ
jgi:Zn-dependent protease